MTDEIAAFVVTDSGTCGHNSSLSRNGKLDYLEATESMCQ